MKGTYLWVQVGIDIFQLSRVVGIIASDGEWQSAGWVVVSVKDLDETVTRFLTCATLETHSNDLNHTAYLEDRPAIPR
jgi:hypothetical protein